MQICGLNKTTLLDFPGHVAATIFTGGCNFRCPFCHNGDLVLSPQSFPKIEEETILQFLQKRKNILTGVCISGGEPTLYPNLEAFIKKIKEIGYLIKLDTNGYQPKIMIDLVQKNLLDYIAMDIKSSKQNYAAASGIPDIDIERINESVSFLKNCTITYEFRTTVVKGIHTAQDFIEIGEWLKGISNYYLQSFKESDAVISKGFSSFSKNELEMFLKISQKYIPNTFLRGVDE